MEMSTQKSYSEHPTTVRVRLWRAEHPERWKAYQQKARAKVRKPCKFCNEPITNSEKGMQYHEKCSRIVGVQRQRAFREVAQKELQAYKESLGCSRCGYNRCGASLDFHHKNPAEKTCRIPARDWKFQSPRILAELEKCVLLCKNCHAEEHHLV